MAYMAGFPDHAGRPWQRSLSFGGEIVLSPVALGGHALLG